MTTQETLLAAELTREVEQQLQDLMSRPSIRHDAMRQGRSKDIWSAAVDGEWFTVLVDEESGGLGLGLHTMSSLFACFGRALAPGPLLEHALVAPMLLRIATPSSYERLQSAIAGERQLAFADGAATGQAKATRPRLVDGQLLGNIDMVRYAATADDIVVVVDGENGTTSIVLVNANDDTVTITSQPHLDTTACLATVHFDHTSYEIVSDEPETQLKSHLERIRGGIRLLTACRLAGVCRTLLDMSVDYAKLREQFGVPIGSFQAVQHILADMAVDTILLEALCEVRADECGADGSRLHWAGIESKACAAGTARRVGEAALQVHGGIGFTAEHELHVWFLHAIGLQGWYGDESDLSLQLGRSLLSGERSS
ncbi:acyl-CoA dehydrogenase family protein [Pseudarthrobacter sp. B4EP4b]|uniref:acyl-CoA dehydrogenase family protein n=1 Tax=Pseudarthrobacter sp. B4EP4b TaxID=2590664 RepID=UPI0015EEBB36|nr:acyl-CoA dehydrogenase family protein [Pseudarthrobacter sp. B4EP4b]